MFINAKVSPRLHTPSNGFQRGHRKVRSESSGFTLMSNSPVTVIRTAQSLRPRSSSIEENGNYNLTILLACRNFHSCASEL